MGVNYQAQAATLAGALHEKFFDPVKNNYASGEQPYLAFPLLVNVVPPSLRATVLQNLVDAVQTTAGGHIDAGMHGTYFLLKFLMEADRNDLIYEMASQTDYPGWGYMLAQGATTSWESWSGADSHIHDTLISIGSWFIQGVGGIRLDEQAPGFKHCFIEPALVGKLTSARATYQSPQGLIVSDWRIDNGMLRLTVTVPVGTTATVGVPTTAPESVTEGGRPVAQAPGVQTVGMDNDRARFLVGSGQYEFASRLAQ